MRRIRDMALVLVAIVTLFSATGALAGPSEVRPAANPNKPSSAELVEKAKQWDGQGVTYTGEAVGDIMTRGDHAWLHLNDDAYYALNVEEGAPLGGYNSGHAVWIARDLAEGITTVGDYTHEGDIVRVTGTFNAACGEHGGDMDIHADSLEVLTPGHVVREVVHPYRALLAVVLAVFASLLWWLNRRLTHRERRGLFGLR